MSCCDFVLTFAGAPFALEVDCPRLMIEQPNIKASSNSNELCEFFIEEVKSNLTPIPELFVMVLWIIRRLDWHAMIITTLSTGLFRLLLGC